jgi:Arc/MetJ-type ribon-helix-helix transcriptional regulator
MSIDIPAEFLPYVRDVIASGQYPSESALVGEALKLLRERDRDRKLVEEGLNELDRGEYLEFDEEGLQRFLDNAQREAFDELRAEGRIEK